MFGNWDMVGGVGLEIGSSTISFTNNGQLLVVEFIRNSKDVVLLILSILASLLDY